MPPSMESELAGVEAHFLQPVPEPPVVLVTHERAELPGEVEGLEQGLVCGYVLHADDGSERGDGAHWAD